MKIDLVELVTENWAYKLVALFIALILWLTILGRRDFVTSKSVELDLLTAPGHVVATQSAESIRVKVSGSRTALKKFMDSALSHSLTVDISKYGSGVVDVEIPVDKLEVPLGVKVIGVRPLVVRTEVKRIDEKPSEEKFSEETK